MGLPLPSGHSQPAERHLEDVRPSPLNMPHRPCLQSCCCHMLVLTPLFMGCHQTLGCLRLCKPCTADRQPPVCRVGTSMDWSVVVHAYGNPLTTNWQLRQPYQAYTFSDLGYVTQFQQAWLRNLSVANPAIAPQAMLAASEQGWDTGSANQGREAPAMLHAGEAVRMQRRQLLEQAAECAAVIARVPEESRTRLTWGCVQQLWLSTYARAMLWPSTPATTWSL